MPGPRPGYFIRFVRGNSTPGGKPVTEVIGTVYASSEPIEGHSKRPGRVITMEALVSPGGSSVVPVWSKYVQLLCSLRNSRPAIALLAQEPSPPDEGRRGTEAVVEPVHGQHLGRWVTVIHDLNDAGAAGDVDSAGGTDRGRIDVLDGRQPNRIALVRTCWRRCARSRPVNAGRAFRPSSGLFPTSAISSGEMIDKGSWRR